MLYLIYIQPTYVATLGGIMGGKKLYAHSLEGQPPEKWQPLDEHLANVADGSQTR